MLFYESTDKLRSQNGAGNEGRGGLLVRQDAVMEGGQRYEYTSNILNTIQQSMKTAFRRKGRSVLTSWPFLYYRRIEHFHSTKGSICIKIEFNSQRFSLGHQHGRHFFVLGHQHGRCDVM